MKRTQRRVLVVTAAVFGGWALIGAPQPAKAGAPKVGTECKPCATCDAVVGSTHVPLFPAPCPPPA